MTDGDFCAVLRAVMSQSKRLAGDFLDLFQAGESYLLSIQDLETVDT